MLALGPQHPIRHKFDETHFFADIDMFLSDLKIEKSLHRPFVRSKN